MREAHITINGVALDSAHAMAVRVAVASMLTRLAEPGFMADLGAIGPLYRARLSEVQELLLRGASK